MVCLEKIGTTEDWGKWIHESKPKAVFNSLSKLYKKAFKIRREWKRVSFSLERCVIEEKRQSITSKIAKLKKEYSTIMMDILVRHLKICKIDFVDIEKELNERLAEVD